MKYSVAVSIIRIDDMSQEGGATTLTAKHLFVLNAEIDNNIQPYKFELWQGAFFSRLSSERTN